MMLIPILLLMMLRSEAYNSRVITSWLADECSQAYERHPTERMLLTYTCVHALHAWHCELEQCDRYLTQLDSYLEFINSRDPAMA